MAAAARGAAVKATSAAAGKTTTWHLVDGRGQPVGRLATRVARALMGKDSPSYVPNDTSATSVVVVVNADRVKFTGKKWKQKKYFSHSGYPGGLSSLTAEQVAERKALTAGVLYRAVKGMLPRNRLQKHRLRRLRLFAGGEHPHTDVLPAVPEQALNDPDDEPFVVGFPVEKVENPTAMDLKYMQMDEPKRLERPNKKAMRKKPRKRNWRVILPEDLDAASK